jgi:hypothetical protein
MHIYEEEWNKRAYGQNGLVVGFYNKDRWQIITARQVAGDPIPCQNETIDENLE